MQRPMADHAARPRSLAGYLGVSLLIGAALFQPASSTKLSNDNHGWQSKYMRETKQSTPARRSPPPPSTWQGRIPLVITNRCDDTIWPGLATQAGTGPGTGGFELVSGASRNLWVSGDWQGRIWGRTNCTGKGDSCVCKTGDCLGKLSCEYSGATPATLAEFNLAGGVNGDQTFYDISLVDGYNIPLGISYIANQNTTFIPPNLTNCACIGTAGWLYNSSSIGTYYTNTTYPMPLEAQETNQDLANWCPWPLLAFPPTKPGDGVYPYPDDNIQRPAFSPCFSACAKSGSDKDCCVGAYHDPNKCKPSKYSKSAKAMCPDAYSYAFDDQSSTFIVPKGGGWEVTMCPQGRSTDILRQLGAELDELARNGRLSTQSKKRLGNATYIAAAKGAAEGVRPQCSATILSVAVGFFFLSVL